MNTDHAAWAGVIKKRRREGANVALCVESAPASEQAEEDAADDGHADGAGDLLHV